MSDLVKRLRSCHDYLVKHDPFAQQAMAEEYPNTQTAYGEAADRIEALEAENKTLRKENVELCEALQPFAALGEAWLPIDEKDKSTWVIAPDSTPVNNLTNFGFTFGHFRAAARVLLAKGDGK